MYKYVFFRLCLNFGGFVMLECRFLMTSRMLLKFMVCLNDKQNTKIINI